MLVLSSLLLCYGVLPILIRLYLYSYSLENYAELGSTPTISLRIPTILSDGAANGQAHIGHSHSSIVGHLCIKFFFYI